ncbi:hypothetical protein, partial [Achromobacter marplatensis]|uniref:hypothetical protein n=1 Tax=Achromobacter marplatensis TaxID=470868 RepID=UPI00103DC350
MGMKVSAFREKPRNRQPAGKRRAYQTCRAHAVNGPTTRGSKPEISAGHPSPLIRKEQAMEITTTQAVATMQKYGGNGVQKLAAC